MLDRRLLVLTMLLLTGCVDLGPVRPMQPVQPVHTRTDALDVASALMSQGKTQAQQADLVADVNKRYSRDPSADHLLALALVYAVPDQPQSSTAKALSLLEKLDIVQLTPNSRLLAKWLSRELVYRDSLERRNTKLGDQLANMAALKAALAQARKKIEILTRIEQTIGPTPQLDQSPGVSKH